MSSDNRNIILAVVLSAMVLFGWEYLFGQKPQPAPVVTQTSAPASDAVTATSAPTASSPSSSASAVAPVPLDDEMRREDSNRDRYGASRRVHAAPR